MKPTWQTTEFWVMIVTNVMGLLTVLGVVGAEHGEEIGNALKAIAGAVITIFSTLGYIKARTEIKTARIKALMSVGDNESASDAMRKLIRSIGA